MFPNFGMNCAKCWQWQRTDECQKMDTTYIYNGMPLIAIQLYNFRFFLTTNQKMESGKEIVEARRIMCFDVLLTSTHKMLSAPSLLFKIAIFRKS